MASLFSLLIGLGIAVAIGIISVRDHRWLRASRRRLLDACNSLLENAAITHGPDDFPALVGRYTGHHIKAELIPDTMTIRRLPQLWLSVTRLEALPAVAGFAVLVRPSGNDFYSLTESFPVTLSPPRELPWEVLVRGESENAQPILDGMAQCLGSILADPRVKEIAITKRGVRIVRQASEGRRGEHLLLRQAIFDDAEVPRADFEKILASLGDLVDGAAAQPREAKAA